MSGPALDLSMLDDLSDLNTRQPGGKPLLLDLDRVHEDPEQPRRTFDDLETLAASIRVVGVKVPISVRPHPDQPGHYIVKFGARRRRAALAAGLTQIPAWIDEVLSDFEQVIENLQRSDLTPMELATFISQKIEDGMKRAEIARRLGLHRTQISKYMALIDAPADVEAVYRTGRSTSPETLFELRALYTAFLEETRAWLDRDEDVSRRSIAAFRQTLSDRADDGAAAPEAKKAASARKSDAIDPSLIKRPLVVVKVAGRLGLAVLSRRAEAPDHILVKWDDTAEIEPVPAADVQLLRIDDARRYEPVQRGLTGETVAAHRPSAQPDSPT